MGLRKMRKTRKALCQYHVVVVVVVVVAMMTTVAIPSFLKVVALPMVVVVVLHLTGALWQGDHLAMQVRDVLFSFQCVAKKHVYGVLYYYHSLPGFQ